MPPPSLGDSTNTKQLIVERIRQSTNILVAVSANPSIDALSAALALALTLNKLDKHTTAVFSGQMPAVMQFLNPEKTFENNVDSLRDFIISLDKEKADRLRYKLEKDVVRIFITPYRTTITEKDLQFSQGDFNVDLIIGLGVEKREDLDKAIVGHGRILHDATVVTINANNQQSTLGAVDWHDPNASSLCEMLVSLTEALQKPGLLDAQIATALLTGIVASTDRFSNQHTTPRVMTMSAQLMAAGADQQLVASHIQEAHRPLPQVVEPEEEAATVSDDGSMSIKHKPDKPPKEPMPADTKAAEEELEASLPPLPQIQPEKALADLTAELEETAKLAKPRPAPAPAPPVEPPPSRGFVSEPPTSERQGEPFLATDQAESGGKSNAKSSWQGHRVEPLTEPSLGGSLSATSEEALEDQLRSEESDRNHKILSHGEGDTVEGGGNSQTMTHGTSVVPPPLNEAPTLEPITKSITPPEPPMINGVDNARQAVDSALASQPFDPSRNPTQRVGAQPVPDASDIQPYIPIEPPASAPAPQAPQEEQHGLPTDVNGLPIIPPMPALPTQEPGGLMQTPPMPPPLPPLPGDSQTPPTDSNQSPVDPSQFKIPGS